MVTHCLSRVEPCFKFRWDSQKSPTISQHWTLPFSLNWHKKATYISITVGKRCSHTSAHLSSFSFTTLIRYMLVIPHFRWLYKLKGGESSQRQRWNRESHLTFGLKVQCHIASTSSFTSEWMLTNCVPWSPRDPQQCPTVYHRKLPHPHPPPHSNANKNQPQISF